MYKYNNNINIFCLHASTITHSVSFFTINEKCNERFGSVSTYSTGTNRGGEGRTNRLFLVIAY